MVLSVIMKPNQAPIVFAILCLLFSACGCSGGNESIDSNSPSTPRAGKSSYQENAVGLPKSTEPGVYKREGSSKKYSSPQGPGPAPRVVENNPNSALNFHGRLGLGRKHTCIVFNSKVFCFGKPGQMRLGLDMTPATATAQPKKGPMLPINEGLFGNNAFISVTAARDHSCAITTTNFLKCWGQRYSPIGPTGSPTWATGIPATGGWEFHSLINTKADYACWIFTSPSNFGELHCYDRHLPYGSKVSSTPIGKLILQGVLDGASIEFAAGGHFHMCAIRADTNNHRLGCWGWNEFGELGNGTFDRSAVPVAPKGLEDTEFSVVAIGGFHESVRGKIQKSAHTCAITRKDGKMYCWGRNSKGQLFRRSSKLTLLGKSNDNINVPMLVNVPGVSRWKWVSAGAKSTYAIADNNKLYAVGSNSFGQLGTGDTTDVNGVTPKPMLATDKNGNVVSEWDHVEAGDFHVCAIRHQNGSKLPMEVYCAGKNEAGQADRTQRKNLVDTNVKRLKLVSIDQ
jgi:alpha-tubulin suppressor-like RCC1 family protein